MKGSHLHRGRKGYSNLSSSTANLSVIVCVPFLTPFDVTTIFAKIKKQLICIFFRFDIEKGDSAWSLCDSKNIPIEILCGLAAEKNLRVDMQAFHLQLEEHKGKGFLVCSSV